MRIAFVTGGGSGLGKSIAHRLAADGFSVAIADIDQSSAELVAKEIQEDGARALALRCDVSSLDSVKEAVATATERLKGGLDVLVNNAGFDEPEFFLQTDPELWDRLIAVNLKGVLNCTFAAAPLIAESCRESGYGRIINIASDAGRVGSLGEAVYAAAKGGVIAFTKAMARELARDKITVNAICPGPADTPMTDRIRSSALGDKLMARMADVTPLKRLALPEDVAGLVSYFARDEANFITAQVVSVSGGLTIPG
ncbi:MAG: 2-hydroxycyclohexanecarboxyl-CoA dehydrogenase [Actinomycetota bacterium]|jgi:2-hydroxycyclohexanecarboxyl-CoA dehydrogenase|nr:2-hydroxycyclohexanecarboxyl-CoA dehydrogenase [Actinomycetota bacterium]